MVGVTVEELAKQVGNVPIERIIEQLAKAGVHVEKKTDKISLEEKEKLFKMLHGEQAGNAEEMTKKISLKRKKLSTLKVKTASGKSSVVNIVNKKRHTYVKKENPDVPAVPEVEDTDAILHKKEPAKESEKEVATIQPAKGEVADNKAKEASTPPAAAKDAKATSTEQDKKDSKTKKKKSSHGKSQEEDREKRRAKKSKSQLIAEEDARGEYRYRAKKIKKDKSASEVNPHAFAMPSEPKVMEIQIPETIVLSELAQKMSAKSADVIKYMMQLGAMATINQVIDQDTACLVVEEMGHKALPITSTSIEDTVSITYQEESEPRPAIVTVMGHVDHGKTSLLDAIRSSKVAVGEAGGITQHIGAYMVEYKNHKITFLDTPGHSAFTAMRARGANCTDVVILVVAADDGVMPQTIEAIQHAKAAEVPIVVAINKMDKPEADKDRVTNELSQHDLLPESWGGDIQFIDISAKSRQGIDELLDAVLLQYEILELKAPKKGPAQGVVIESRIERGRGPVASVLVQKGTLYHGDMILAGLEFGRVKAMHNENGISLKTAGPSVPVEILGLSGAPGAGDSFMVVANERKAREIALHRQGKFREIRLSRQNSSSLEGFMDKVKEQNLTKLNIVLKADVQGSVEAITDALEKISNDEVKITMVAKGVGAFSESDINLALASDALLIGFNVRAESSARKLVQTEGLEINYFSVIYDVINMVKSFATGKLKPIFKDTIIGLAEVKDVFKSSKIGSIAGCLVLEGVIKRSKKIRVLRDNVVIYEGELESLRRFKDEAQEVNSGTECGIGVKDYNDVKIGDQIEVYESVEVKRKLNEDQLI